MKLILAGAGATPGDLSLKVWELTKKTDKIILRTAQTKVGKWLTSLGFDYVALDDVYDKSRNFDTLAKNLAKEVLRAAKTQNVLYLVEGDVKEDVSCALIIKKRQDAEVIPGVSKADYFLDKAGVNGKHTAVSAYEITETKLSLPLVVYDVDSPIIASRVKLVLSDLFGDEIPCYKFFNGTFSEILLYESDYGTDFDETSAIVIKDLPLAQKKRFDLYDLHDILKVLRSENGCPWDRAQTPETITKNTLEETYELIDAVLKKDTENVTEELGDFMLQAFFYVCFGEESKAFTLSDVSSGICHKLISRHSHIFGSDSAKDSAQALDVWEKNKQKEKGFSSGAEYLESVPKSFPAVLRAHKVGSRSKKYNMDFSSYEEAAKKVKEEYAEVLEEVKRGNEKGVYEESGDLLFAVVSFVRLLGVDGELALNAATDKFLKRFRKTEELVLKDGKNMRELSAEELDKYYHESKKY